MTNIQTLIHDPVSLRLFFSLLILIVFTAGRRFLRALMINKLSTIRIRQLHLDAAAFTKLNKPLDYLLLVSGIFIALAVSPFVYYNSPTEQVLLLGDFKLTLSIISLKMVGRFFSTIIALLITWLVYDLEHLYEHLFTSFNTKWSLIDNTVFIRYISRIISFITLAAGILISMGILIPNFSKIVTGVGIGGVAIAYVAKDSLASMFSGMILLLDKPFVIRDWVDVNGIEGIVEDISFRSTRIRTFDQSLVVIPNSTVGNASIINWSRMKKRRVSFELGVSYDTTQQQIHDFSDALRKYFSAHRDIEPDTYLVHFTSMGDYTLNIQIIYYSLHTDLASFMALKEEVNLQILSLCSTFCIDIAFPTQTVYLSENN